MLHIGAALPDNLAAGIFAIPYPSTKWCAALATKEPACEGIPVLIFPFPYIAFGLSAQSNLYLRFLPYFFAYDGRMMILNIIAVDFAMIDALLFAEAIFAVGLLQLGITLVLFVFEDIQHGAGMPLASGNGSDLCGIQFFRNDKRSLTA